MKIIIVGAGRIGTGLAKALAEENNEVYLIERDERVAAKNAEKLDVKVIIGNGADPENLKAAHIDQADLVLAVTTSDETNLIVCSLSGLFGAKRRIARVRNVALNETLMEFGYNQFNINETIHPELVAAQAIVKMIETPGASEVADFADGKILLRAFELSETSSLCGIKMEEFREEDFPWPFLIVSIIRDEKVVIPKGDTILQADDKIYALLPAPSLAEFLIFVNPDVKLAKKIVIHGATITGKYVAKSLQSKIKDIIVLEEDIKEAKRTADELTTVTVINGSGAEGEILTEAGVEAADVFIATSKNDQSNLISSVLAKKMGAKATIITSQQEDYMSIIDALDVDGVVNPYALAVEQILHLVRGKGISAVTKLLDGNAEALEFIPEKDSPVTKHLLKDIKFPKNSIVGAVCSEEGVALAKGDTQLHEGEKVIVFCQESAVKRLQELFTRKKLFK